MYPLYSSAPTYHQSPHIPQDMEKCLKRLKNQMSEQQTITLEIMLRIKTMNSRLENSTRYDESYHVVIVDSKWVENV